MNTRKTINKETQEAIRKFLASSTSSHTLDAKTPKMELDLNFSRILQHKREEQLEASRRKLFDSTTFQSDSTIAANDNDKTSASTESLPIKKNIAFELENSMVFNKVNKSWQDTSIGDDSFLALERQCNMDDKKEQILNADDTMLFDVEPPNEIWNQSVNQSIAITHLNRSLDENDTIEMSPVKYIGLIRPSTIIEETSSQFESSSQCESSSQYESAQEASIDSIRQKLDYSDDKVSPLVNVQNQNEKPERGRRGTFAFKRANYTFFPNENLDPINEKSIEEFETPKKCTPIASSSKTPLIENNEDEFNNTLERVDYLLEKGKQIIDETHAKRKNSILETPLFSCKRKRLLNEMASIEMLPLPKRGPLIDFSTPVLQKTRNASKLPGNRD